MKSLAVMLFLITPYAAHAQQQFAAPDRELWEVMAKALSDVPMSLSAHQQIQAILNNVQREASIRKAKAEADARSQPK